MNFLSNFNGKTDLYDCAQKQIDELDEQGADVIVALTHLGVDDESAADENRSTDVYAHTKGINIMLDGHSHAVMTAGEKGEPIQSTGTKFKNIGVVVIDDAGKKIEDNYLIPTEKLAKDESVQTEAQKIMTRLDEEYGKTFAKSEVEMDGSKKASYTAESALGNLVTDAMVWSVLKEKGSLKVDENHVIGLMNGGGIRASIAAGDITKNDIKQVLPFGNTLSVVYVTGAQLLEVLEASAYCTPEKTSSYPQTSKVTFTLDTTKAYAQGALYEGSKYYAPSVINRMTIEKINGKAFSLTDTYAVVTNEFCAVGGDSYHVFKNNEKFDTGIVLDEIVTEYITDELKGTITAEKYGKPRGDQKILTSSPEENSEDKNTEEKDTGEKDTEGKDTEKKKAGEKSSDSEKADKVSNGTRATVKGAVYRVTSKGEAAFVSGKKNAAVITIPAAVKINGISHKVTSISAKALKGDKKLKKLIVGKNITSIKKSAFLNCSALKKITIRTKSLKKIGAKAFKGVAKKAVAKVPVKMKKKYASMMKKSGYKGMIYIRKM